MASANISAETDRLNRRRRDRRRPIGKSITLQERDWLWLQKLHQHGPLPSGFLHDFSRPIARSEKRAKDRLTDLFNEERTPHRGAYFDRPPQQFRTLDARYQPLVYDLAPAGKRALKQAGFWSDYSDRHAGPWTHKFMVSSITASIELAAAQSESVNFISQHTILERANTKLRHDVVFEDPRTGKQRRAELIPDAIFGLEYLVGNSKFYRFFLVEADRATEPTRASKFNRKSHLRNALQYREYVGRGLYKDHLRLTAGLLVLNITSSQTTEKAMLNLWSELSPQGNSYQLVQTAPEFGDHFKPPTVFLQKLLGGSWARAGQPQLRIDQP